MNVFMLLLIQGGRSRIFFYISGSGQILAPASTPTPTSTPAPAPTSTPVSTLKHVMFTLKQLPLN